MTARKTAKRAKPKACSNAKLPTLTMQVKALRATIDQLIANQISAERSNLVATECMLDVSAVIKALLRRTEALEARKGLRDRSGDAPVSNHCEISGTPLPLPPSTRLLREGQIPPDAPRFRFRWWGRA